MGYFLPPLAVRTRSIATLTTRLIFFVPNSSSRTLTASSLESNIFSMQSDVEMTRSSHARRFPLIKNEAETCEHGLDQLKAGACIHLRTMLAAAALEAAAAAAAAVAVPRMRPACGRDCECGRGRRKIWAGPSVWAAWPASPSSGAPGPPRGLFPRISRAFSVHPSFFALSLRSFPDDLMRTAPALRRFFAPA